MSSWHQSHYVYGSCRCVGCAVSLSSLILIVPLMLAVECLRLSQLDIPPTTIVGETIEMSCLYELDNDSLYAVKWYKNGREFFRYVPQDWPSGQYLKIDGVKVDLENSNHQTVILKDISLRASGNYRCEVSTDAPSFITLSVEKYMFVYALPKDGPVINGHKKYYKLGDLININCTASESKPAAYLRWLVNDRIQAEPEHQRLAAITDNDKESSHLINFLTGVTINNYVASANQLEVNSSTTYTSSIKSRPNDDDVLNSFYFNRSSVMMGYKAQLINVPMAIVESSTMAPLISDNTIGRSNGIRLSQLTSTTNGHMRKEYGLMRRKLQILKVKLILASREWSSDPSSSLVDKADLMGPIDGQIPNLDYSSQDNNEIDHDKHYGFTGTRHYISAMETPKDTGQRLQILEDATLILIALIVALINGYLNCADTSTDL